MTGFSISLAPEEIPGETTASPASLIPVMIRCVLEYVDENNNPTFKETSEALDIYGAPVLIDSAKPKTPAWLTNPQAKAVGIKVFCLDLFCFAPPASVFYAPSYKLYAVI